MTSPEEAGELEQRESSPGSMPGGPTRFTPVEEAAPTIPPVGLNWETVSRRLGVDRRILQHDGLIVVAGEYFPGPGYFMDPRTLRALHVGIGDMATRTGYFIGEISAQEFGLHLPVEQERPIRGARIIAAPAPGPIIGLFVDEQAALRARDRILRGSLGVGIQVEHGPLGYELTVKRSHSPGMVATVIAGFGGAVISIGGVPLAGEL